MCIPHTSGWVENKQGQYAQAETHLQEGLSRACQICQREYTGLILAHLGTIAGEKGDYLLEEAYEEKRAMSMKGG